MKLTHHIGLLSAAATAAFSKTVSASSSSTGNPPRDFDTPYQILDNGASVYSNGRSGGRIELKTSQPYSPTTTATSFSPPLFFAPPEDDEGNTVIVDPPEEFIDDEEPQPIAYKVDLSFLNDIKADSLTFDLDSAKGPIVLVRDDIDERLAAAHEAAAEMDASSGSRRNLKNNNNNNNKRTTKIHRRINDLATDDLPCNLDNINNNNNIDEESSTFCNFQLEPGTDYLPPNESFPPDHFSQKYEYFESKSTIIDNEDEDGTTTTASAFLMLKKHPTTGVKHLAGLLQIGELDYTFSTDEVGNTMVTVGDTTTYPSMNEPQSNEQDCDEDVWDPDDSSGLPLRGVCSSNNNDGGGGSTRNLRNGMGSGGSGGSGGSDEAASFIDGSSSSSSSSSSRPSNPIYEQFKAQSDRHLKGELKRLNRRRELQNYEDGSIIDVMIAYTNGALCEKNGLSPSHSSCSDPAYVNDPSNNVNIIDVATASVAWTNQAYKKSGIETQLRLVHTYRTPNYDDTSSGPGKGQCGAMLDDFTYKNDNHMDEVHTKRESWGADMLVLLTSHVGGCGGIAWVGHVGSYSYSHLMFSVTKQRFSIGGTFAHELGHNFGCWHDRKSSGNKYPYQYGYQNEAARIRSVMAYECSPMRCPRVQMFSTPHLMWDGHKMGDAQNDCARVHNEQRGKISRYRSVRVTASPTKSNSPSASLMPSEPPTKVPTLSPTKSSEPSLAPTASDKPSITPSMWPTYSNAELEDFLKLDAPPSRSFQTQHGIMFDVTAKDYQIEIHNFRIPFEKAGDMVVSVWSQDAGGFWYEKNNANAWTLQGSPDVYSPGITLRDPMPLWLRGSRSGTYFGFQPIVIPAGTTKGIYLVVNETSTDDNLIASDRKALSQCAADYQEPYDFATWAENDDLSISEGVYKEGWHESGGNSNGSYRFLGSIYYESARPAPATSITDAPTLSLTPSMSSAPSVSTAPVIPALNELGYGLPLNNVEFVDGVMFEVFAKEENILIRNLELLIYSVQDEYFYDLVSLSVYTTPGSLYNQGAGDAVDQALWTERGTVQVFANDVLDPKPLPEGSFEPIFIKAGTAMGIYVTIKDSKKNHKLGVTFGTMPLLSLDLEDSNVKIREGLTKTWYPCLGWGGTRVDVTGTPYPRALWGTVEYTLGGTSVPTMTPSVDPLATDSPTFDSLARLPSAVPSGVPTVTLNPSLDPTTSPMPTETLSELVINKIYGDGTEGNTGMSGDGVMFDVVAKSPSNVYSLTFGIMSSFPMNIQVWSRAGSHYAAYDDMSQWDLLASYTNYTYNIGDAHPGRIRFPRQFIGLGKTRAFYIAIVETYGELRPLSNGMMPGNNYLTGVWEEDDTISIMEGLKFYGVTPERPFGSGTDTDGVFMHAGPGGVSFNLKSATLRYEAVETIPPSVAPSTSQVPTLSQGPSVEPTGSQPPSQNPSVSSLPSLQPSSQPSASQGPTAVPTGQPSEVPSTSQQPTEGPSISSAPSSIPSTQPSIEPTMHPSESPSVSSKPSDTPSLAPTDIPSISNMPSFSPSISLVPTMETFKLDSAGGGQEYGTYGTMFEVVPKRAINVESFWVATYSFARAFTAHVYTRRGSWTDVTQNPSAWTKIGEQSYQASAAAVNPVKISPMNIDSVPLMQGQTQSFYIHFIGENFMKVTESSMGYASENGDVSLYAGHAIFSSGQNELFSPGGSGILFRGKMLYTLGIDPPSVAPSEKPSEIPSEHPTPLSSQTPSISGRPSEGPSYPPSSTTAYPTHVPSISLMPSTTPTNIPTKNPTMGPSPSPSSSLAPTESEPVIRITIPASIRIGGFGRVGTTVAEIETVITIVAKSLRDLAKTKLIGTQKVKQTCVKSVNGITVPPEKGCVTELDRRKLSSRGVQEEKLVSSRGIQDEIQVASRRLEDAEDPPLDVEFEIILEESCDANVDCSDSQAVANAFYDQVSESLQDAINQGDLADVLDETAEDNGITLVSVIQESSFDDFETTVTTTTTTVTTLLASWYPTWKNGQFCGNDGNEPLYMKKKPSTWLYTTLEGCCTRYYSFDLGGCMGESSASIGFYPDWEGKNQNCLNDTNVPDYMRTNPSQWVYDDIESCCERYYNYDIPKCLSESGVENTGSNNWYVNYKLKKCVQDCTEGAPCGGLAKPWDDILSSSSECCTTKLWWVEQSECVHA